MYDITEEELNAIADDVDAEIEANGPFTDEDLMAEIEKLNASAKKEDVVFTPIVKGAPFGNKNAVGPHRHAVVLRGGSIGGGSGVERTRSGKAIHSVHATPEEAAAKVKRMNKILTPGERGYYGMKYSVADLSKDPPVAKKSAFAESVGIVKRKQS